MVAPEVKNLMDDIWAKKAEKKAAAEKRKEDREENGVINKLLIERLPMGLYHCRYELGGPIPGEFEGYFTNLARIKSLAIRRWGNEDKLKPV